MNMTTQEVLRHFLSQYLLTLEKKKTPSIDDFFKGYFTHQELLDMHLFIHGQHSEHSVTKTLSHTVLLEGLSSHQILSYFLEKWKKEQELNRRITKETVQSVLQQLGLRTHYLAYKNIVDWDKYDQSNYQSLLRKSGRIQKVYGWFDMTVPSNAVDYVTTPLQRWYPTKEMALRVLEEKNLDAKEVHLLTTYKST